MKRILSLIVAAAAVLNISAQNRSHLPQWQEGYMDIHLIATGRGESTFIVMPDGTKMLIDAGDIGDRWSCPVLPDTSKTVGEWISAYVDNFSKGTPSEGSLDYFLLTHFHSDHMGSRRSAVPGEKGYGLSGITMVGENTSISKVVDRGWPSYDFPSKEHVEKVSEGFIKDYRMFLEASGAVCEKFEVGSSSQFVPVNAPDRYKETFRIVNLGANGSAWTGEGLESRPSYKGDPAAVGENSFSCAIRIDYGKFRYYTGGDLTGGWWGMTPEKNPKERDFETAVAKVCGPVTAAKLDHHGWKDSANAFFLRTLRPEVFLISSSDKSQPQYYTLKRVLDTMIYEGHREIYCTTDAAKEANPKPSHFEDRMTSIGHIVLRVYAGGDSYQVFVMQNDDATYPLIYRSEIKNIR